MKLRHHRLLGWLAAVALLASCTTRPDVPDIDGQDVEVVFLHTSDIHSRLFPYNIDVGEVDKTMGLEQANGPFGGMSRLAAVIKQERANHRRVAYIDTGDVFQGAPIFNSFIGEPELRAMSQLGVDAFAIGNHEFDNGTSHLSEQALKFARFPMLAANFALGDPNFEANIPTGRVAQPYTVINMGGLRVAVIGVGFVGGSPSHGGGSRGVVELRHRDVVQSYVDFLRPQVDLVAVASHGGWHEDQEIIPRTEGVDIYFGGHLHIALNPPNVIQDCDIAKLERERDRFMCDTPEKLRQAGRACETKNECDALAGSAADSCRTDCFAQAAKECAAEAERRKYAERLKMLDADIAFLRKRGCHPRDVLLVHSGAFLKYMGKLEVTARQCHRLEQKEVCAERDALGQCIHKVGRRCVGNRSATNDWEVIAHRYTLVPIDKTLPEDPQMMGLLAPFRLQMAGSDLLSQIIGYTSTRLWRFSNGDGDSQLGNMLTEAMRSRAQVWADFAVTNSLGIRSDIVAGPVDHEQMTNVFPFENTITVMYLSGYEVQEMMDFVAKKTASRGCQPQAQIAGITATLNCGGCPGDGGNPCIREPYDGDTCAQRVTIGGTGRPCKSDKDCKLDAQGQLTGEICTGQRHPDPKLADAGMTRCWMPISCTRNYRMAANDYIAHGGSGFSVLGRNTTQVNLGIPLRESAKDFIANMPPCSQIPQSDQEKFSGAAPRYVVDQEDASALEDMERAALQGELAAANGQLESFRKRLEDRQATATGDEAASLTNYLSCISEEQTRDKECLGLTCREVRRCAAFEVRDLQRCQTLARIRAAIRCRMIPCIKAQEDGRLQRVFRDSSGSPNPFDPWPD